MINVLKFFKWGRRKMGNWVVLKTYASKLRNIWGLNSGSITCQLCDPEQWLTDVWSLKREVTDTVRRWPLSSSITESRDELSLKSQRIHLKLSQTRPKGILYNVFPCQKLGGEHLKQRDTGNTNQTNDPILTVLMYDGYGWVCFYPMSFRKQKFTARDQEDPFT